jgi:hydrogenase-4 component B
VLLLVLGAISALLGVAFALGQHDLKRLLAYHSVENIGIIVMGLGLAMLGRSLGRADWTVLGLAGGLLHVWNHGLFKSLLFLSAGSVVHATRTREIDRMGGLAKSMPLTSALFLVGAVAICGLPPLNGFVSELLVYLGLFRTLGPPGGASSPASALAVPCLAMIGALAVACFVKAYGAVFLGSARDECALHAHEAPAPMIGPMIVLAACCAVIGLSPILVAPVLDQVAKTWPGSGGPAGLKIGELLPWGWISGLGALVVAFLALVGAVFLRRRARESVPAVGTWDCGYARPTPRMQYTSSSFAQSLVGLFRSVMRPRTHRPGAIGVFPKAARFESHVDDVVLDGFIFPAFRRMGRWIDRLRVFQHGRVQEYILYVLVALILLLLWILPIDELVRRIFTR